jgi:hypothetical protein
MRLVRYLQEKYLASYKKQSANVPIEEKYRQIYVNPTKDEVKQLVKDTGVTRFRFIAIPKEKKLVVWPIRSEIHNAMTQWLQNKMFIKPIEKSKGDDPKNYIGGFIQADSSGEMSITEPQEGQQWVEYSYKHPVDFLKKYINNYKDWIREVNDALKFYGYDEDYDGKIK